MTDPHAVPRDSRRVPLETRVQLSFERFSGFISEYSSNISPGGMFIRTREPKPPGTVLGFELRLGDGFELIRGRGEVIWSRATDDSAERRAGMGIRFLELSPGSRELIYRMVDQHILDGGTPFDLAAPAAPAPPHPPGLETGAASTGTSVGALSGSALRAIRTAGQRPSQPAAPRSAGPLAGPSPAAAIPAGAAPLRPAVARVAGPILEVVPPDSSPTGAGPAPPAGASGPSPVPSAVELGSGPAPMLARDPSAGTAPLVPSAAAAAVSPPAPAASTPGESTAAHPGGWPEPLRAAAGAMSSFPPAAPIPQAPPPSQARARPPVRWGVLRWGALAALLAVVVLAFLNQERLLVWVLRREAASAPRPLPVPGGEPPRRAVAAGDPTVPASDIGAGVSANPPAGNGEVSTVSTAAGAPAMPAMPTTLATPATAIERITWEQEPGGTQVVLWGNGAFSRQSYVHLRIEGEPPRELIRLVDIRRPFTERLTVGTRQVRQVRTGFHQQPAGAELHVVLDLAGPGIEITGIDLDERRLRIHLRGE